MIIRINLFYCTIMEIFNRFARKKMEKQNDKLNILIVLSLLTIFFIWKAIVESGHLFLYIVYLLLWIVAYCIFESIQKKKTSKPASLWIYAKKYPIVVQYAPPKWVGPAEAGLLYNCSVEPTDLTSLIYQWKFENLIDIKSFKWENSNKEYIKLIKKDDMPLTRPLFESEIFDSIFRMGDVKVIEWAFQLRYALMLEDLEYHWIKKWWLITGKNKYEGNKNTILKNNYKNESSIEIAIFSMLLFLLVFWIIMESLGVSNNISITFTEFLRLLAISLLIWTWIVLLCWYVDGWWNLKFTDKWAKLASQVIGYSQFIKSCDENKIQLFLKEDPLFIDRTLPYATAFWMETEFLNKISPMKRDWNAKYVRWTKVPSWIWALRFLTKDDDFWY